MEDDLHLDLLLNKKSNTKNIMKEIYELINLHKINIDISNDTFDNTLNSFLINYIKLTKFLEFFKDDISNRDKVENLIEDIIQKSEDNLTVSLELNNKKIKLTKKLQNNKSNNLNILMTD